MLHTEIFHLNSNKGRRFLFTCLCAKNSMRNILLVFGGGNIYIADFWGVDILFLHSESNGLHNRRAQWMERMLPKNPTVCVYLSSSVFVQRQRNEERNQEADDTQFCVFLYLLAVWLWASSSSSYMRFKCFFRWLGGFRSVLCLCALRCLYP